MTRRGPKNAGTVWSWGCPSSWFIYDPRTTLGANFIVRHLNLRLIRIWPHVSLRRRELRRWTRKSRRFLRSSTYLPLPFITAARINLVRRPAERGGGRERERKELFAPIPSFPGPLTRFCRHQITIMCTEKAFRKIAPNHILLLVSKHSHILDSAELRSPRK